VFSFASQTERKVQVDTDVLCPFIGFKTSGFVLSPVSKHAATRFGHKAIVRCLGYPARAERTDASLDALTGHSRTRRENFISKS
jgi:hypothetical protein